MPVADPDGLLSPDELLLARELDEWFDGKYIIRPVRPAGDLGPRFRKVGSPDVHVEGLDQFWELKDAYKDRARSVYDRLRKAARQRYVVLNGQVIRLERIHVFVSGTRSGMSQSTFIEAVNQFNRGHSENRLAVGEILFKNDFGWTRVVRGPSSDPVLRKEQYHTWQRPWRDDPLPGEQPDREVAPRKSGGVRTKTQSEGQSAHVASPTETETKQTTSSSPAPSNVPTLSAAQLEEVRGFQQSVMHARQSMERPEYDAANHQVMDLVRSFVSTSKARLKQGRIPLAPAEAGHLSKLVPDRTAHERPRETSLGQAMFAVGVVEKLGPGALPNITLWRSTGLFDKVYLRNRSDWCGPCVPAIFVALDPSKSGRPSATPQVALLLTDSHSDPGLTLTMGLSANAPFSTVSHRLRPDHPQVLYLDFDLSKVGHDAGAKFCASLIGSSPRIEGFDTPNDRSQLTLDQLGQILAARPLRRLVIAQPVASPTEQHSLTISTFITNSRGRPRANNGGLEF